ncbi:MAG: hypothetical protein GY844_18485 [Bradyrhizobium sp.]|nr:hypothetical protein [Bradyrhizobium sp.]
MLPNNPNAPRPVRKFELITPDGRVHRFPQPSWPQRLLHRLSSYGDVAALSAGIFVLITIATFAADALDRTALDACNEQLTRTTGIS